MITLYKHEMVVDIKAYEALVDACKFIIKNPELTNHAVYLKCEKALKLAGEI